MLRQESITDVSHAPTAPATLDCDLLAGTESVIEEIQQRLLAGQSVNNRTLSEIADRVYGGSRARGTYTARDAYDATETAVNKLLETQASELMTMSVSDALSQTLRPLTERLPRQSDRTREQVQFQQFSTPPALSYIAARLLNPSSTDIVLEPSAGTGSLAIWPRAIGARVVCNEISTRRRMLLDQILGFETHAVDAEFIHDLLDSEIRPTAVLMNPPFSATGGRVTANRMIYGARHVESALRRLQQGGRLVAIASEAMSFTRPAFSDWWKVLTSTYNVRANFHLTGNEYGKYGTGYGLQILVIDKTGPTPGDSWEQRLSHINWSEADNLESLWDSLQDLETRETNKADESDNAESLNKTLFVPYTPARVKGGKPHPAPIVESASMAAVQPPGVTYRPHLSREIVTEGRLSDIQLERVIYAGQRHEQRLPDGSRAGYYVGDGTGVGKGRILAGIILDNFNQQRKRAIWLSVNNDLLDSTRRDLNDLGADIALARINDYSPADDITLPEGVIFSSYSSLIAAAKNGARRFDQIQRWLGTDGVVIFDEAHKAKNALAGGRGEPTQTGQAVIDLQDATKTPEYRIVYSSATGATDVRNMAYMVRLGLWGDMTSFPGGFSQFLTEIDSGGVGAMEMISRDLKALGVYASASISFGKCPRSGKPVEYRERIHYLTPQQREMYNHAADAWQVVMQNIGEALGITNGGRRARANALNKFWGDHQRFFRQVISAFKVPTVIEETEKAISEGKSVVISLVGTGEARTREQVARAKAAGGTLEDLDFSPREVIANMVNRGFPTTLYRDVTDPITGKTIQEPVRDAEGNIVQSRQAIQMKQALIDGLSALELPENPLDQLVNHFGESDVAELTGRTRRLIRDSRTGRVEYRKRAPEGIPMQNVNVYEMAQFQQGKKRIAIISDAASTGISLHASNREANQQRRVHITLELGWSADKQMQTFGRTHRSDQAVPPEYVLLSTELGGEKRFSSTIARRLGSLGALTKGDRGAADNGDLAKYNFETEEGRAALGLLFRSIMSGKAVPGIDNPRQTLRDMGLLVEQDGVETVRKDDEYNVPRFLNRVLALDVDRQNALFDHYAKLFDEIVSFAKENGTFDEGVTDIKALSVRLVDSSVVHRDQSTGAETTHCTLEIDQPTKKVSFTEAEEAHTGKGGAFFEHLRKGSFILALESGRHTDPAIGATYCNFAVWRPEGARISYIRDAQLTENYRPVVPENVRDWWTTKYATIPDVQTSKLHVIGGAITPLWQSLKTTEATHLRVVRLTTDDGQRIVGVQIPSDHVGEVLGALGVARTLRETNEIFNAVLEDGEEIALTAGLKLKRGAIHRDPVIELTGAHPTMFATLRKLGLINEQIAWKQRFFVPIEEERGNAVIAALLEQFPVIATEDEEADTDVPSEGAIPAENSTQLVDLESWVIAPANTCTNDTTPADQTAITQTEKALTNEMPEATSTRPDQNPSLPIRPQASAPAMLQSFQPDYRTAAIQIGFNFAESES
ncbi:MAG: strawberry notch family protein [Acidobacteriota bacterium]